MITDSRVAYCKPAYTVDNLIKEKLIGRGLAVPDEARARHYLEYIGYYRLGAYLRFFQDGTPTHTYRAGSTFEDALNLYIFDRELRLLAMDALERIEVASRTVISNTMCLRHGPHWFMDPAHFKANFNHPEFMKGIQDEIEKQRLKTPFLEHYDRKYNAPPFPPSWMIAEVMPMGTWSKVYTGLASPKDFLPISKLLGYPQTLIESWLYCVSVLRNACAHHVCVWNKVFTIKPTHPKVDGLFIKDSSRFFAQAVVIQKFLAKISPDSEWSTRLWELFNKYPMVPIGQMGFPTNWEKSQFWGIKDAKPIPKAGAQSADGTDSPTKPAESAEGPK